MLPAFPTGMQSTSSSAPSSSTSSNAAVFCRQAEPLTELTSAIGSRSATPARARAPRRNCPARDTRAPCISACASFPSRSCLRHDHGAGQPGARRVAAASRRCCRSTHRSPPRRPRAPPPRRPGHAAILERAGRVCPLDLEQDLGAAALGPALGVHQRRRALVQRDHGI